MTDQRFNSIVDKLTSDWKFEELLDFFKENAVENHSQLEFCVYLADVGLLDELHEFICNSGLYNLKALARDIENTYEKRENAKIILDIYESEMLPVFERQLISSQSIDSNLLSLSLYRDASVLTNYIESNKETVFQVEQAPKTLMYLAFAVNKLLQSDPEERLLRLLLDHLDGFKRFAPLRKAYLTKLIVSKLLFNEKPIIFPSNGYTGLHKALGIVSAQKNRYKGAAYLYTLVSDVVRHELKRPVAVKVLGWDSKPKVAVCLSGMYRCGNKALESIYKSVIEPLEADVFFHSWTEMQEWPGLGGAGDDWLYRLFSREIFHKCPTALRSKTFFKKKFPHTYSLINTPVQTVFDSTKLPDNFVFKKVVLENAADMFQEQNIDETRFLSLGSLNQAKMLYGIYKAHELAVDYEKEQGFRYDYIVRCRPDLGLSNKLSFSELEKLRDNEVALDFTKEYGPQDQFWYGQRASALSMASLWAASIASNSLSPFPDFPELRAHRLVHSWMTDNHLEPVSTPIRRDMKMVTANAPVPDFSKALAEDFKNEASDLSQDQDVIDFFAALLDLTKK